MRLRLNTLFKMLLLVVAAYGLYMVKYKVQAVQEEVATLSRQLTEERAALHVVAAEWAYLNRPERVQELAERHLQMKPVKTEQIIALDSLPTLPVNVAAQQAPLLSVTAEAKHVKNLLTPVVLKEVGSGAP